VPSADGADEALCWAVDNVRLVLQNGRPGDAELDRGVGTLFVGTKYGRACSPARGWC